MRALVFASLVLAALLAGCGGKLDESLTSLKVGDCVDAADDGNVTGISTVDCDKEGVLRVVKLFDMADAETFPGTDAVNAAAAADDGCPATTTQILGPTQDSWEKARDRQIVCFAEFDLVPVST